MKFQSQDRIPPPSSQKTNLLNRKKTDLLFLNGSKKTLKLILTVCFILKSILEPNLSSAQTPSEPELTWQKKQDKENYLLNRLESDEKELNRELEQAKKTKLESLTKEQKSDHKNRMDELESALKRKRQDISKSKEQLRQLTINKNKDTLIENLTQRVQQIRNQQSLSNITNIKPYNLTPDEQEKINELEKKINELRKKKPDYFNQSNHFTKERESAKKILEPLENKVKTHIQSELKSHRTKLEKTQSNSTAATPPPAAKPAAATGVGAGKPAAATTPKTNNLELNSKEEVDKISKNYLELKQLSEKNSSALNSDESRKKIKEIRDFLTKYNSNILNLKENNEFETLKIVEENLTKWEGKTSDQSTNKPANTLKPPPPAPAATTKPEPAKPEPTTSGTQPVPNKRQTQISDFFKSKQSATASAAPPAAAPPAAAPPPPPPPAGAGAGAGAPAPAPPPPPAKTITSQAPDNDKDKLIEKLAKRYENEAPKSVRTTPGLNRTDYEGYLKTLNPEELEKEAARRTKEGFKSTTFFRYTPDPAGASAVASSDTPTKASPASPPPGAASKASANSQDPADKNLTQNKPSGVPEPQKPRTTFLGNLKRGLGSAVEGIRQTFSTKEATAVRLNTAISKAESDLKDRASQLRRDGNLSTAELKELAEKSAKIEELERRQSGHLSKWKEAEETELKRLNDLGSERKTLTTEINVLKNRLEALPQKTKPLVQNSVVYGKPGSQEFMKLATERKSLEDQLNRANARAGSLDKEIKQTNDRRGISFNKSKDRLKKLNPNLSMPEEPNEDNEKKGRLNTAQALEKKFDEGRLNRQRDFQKTKERIRPLLRNYAVQTDLERKTAELNEAKRLHEENEKNLNSAQSSAKEAADKAKGSRNVDIKTLVDEERKYLEANEKVKKAEGLLKEKEDELKKATETLSKKELALSGKQLDLDLKEKELADTDQRLTSNQKKLTEAENTLTKAKTDLKEAEEREAARKRRPLNDPITGENNERLLKIETDKVKEATESVERSQTAVKKIQSYVDANQRLSNLYSTLVKKNQNEVTTAQSETKEAQKALQTAQSETDQARKKLNLALQSQERAKTVYDRISNSNSVLTNLKEKNEALALAEKAHTASQESLKKAETELEAAKTRSATSTLRMDATSKPAGINGIDSTPPAPIAGAAKPQMLPTPAQPTVPISGAPSNSEKLSKSAQKTLLGNLNDDQKQALFKAPMEVQRQPATGLPFSGASNSGGLTQASTNAVTTEDQHSGIKAVPPPHLQPQAGAGAALNSADDYAGYRSHVTGSGDCAVSTQIGAKYNCQPAQTRLMGYQMGSQGTMMMGMMATQTYGQQQTAQAMTATSQADQLEAAAKMQQTTAITQTALGAVNTALTAASIGELIAQKRHIAAIKNGAEDEAIKQNFGLKALEASGPQGQQKIQQEMTLIKGAAEQEKSLVTTNAGITAFMVGLQAAQQGAMAGVSYASAATLRKQAAELRNMKVDTPSYSQVVIPPGETLDADVEGGVTAPSILGSGADPSAASADSGDSAVTDPPSDLGTGFNTDPLPNQITDSRAPGEFKLGAPGGGPTGGGGGGGVGGGGETSAASAPAEPGATMAQNNESTGYQSGGAAPPGGGGGGGGSGKSGAEGGPDLSGLLAAFLPKKEEAEKPGQSIMDFGSNSKQAQGPVESLLDRNANIFQRISDTYQDKTRRGEINK